MVTQACPLESRASSRTNGGLVSRTEHPTLHPDCRENLLQRPSEALKLRNHFRNSSWSKNNSYVFGLPSIGRHSSPSFGLNNSFRRQRFRGVGSDSRIPHLTSFVPESREVDVRSPPWVSAVITPTGTIRLGDLGLWVRGRRSRGAGGRCREMQPCLLEGHGVGVSYIHYIFTSYLRNFCSCPVRQICRWKTEAWVSCLPRYRR